MAIRCQTISRTNVDILLFKNPRKIPSVIYFLPGLHTFIEEIANPSRLDRSFRETSVNLRESDTRLRRVSDDSQINHECPGKNGPNVKDSISSITILISTTI